MIALLRYGPSLLALLAGAGAGWWVMDLRADRAELRVQNAALTRELAVQVQITEQATEARAVAHAHRVREAARAAELQRGIEALLTRDFENAETLVDPRLADYLDCLRGASGADADDCAGGLAGSADAGADQ